jgi:allantoin racemase
MSAIKLLIINPNSSQSITDALKRSLTSASNSVSLTFFTGPSDAPRGISDDVTARQSTECAMRVLVGHEPDGVGPKLESYDGILVCCCEL